MTKLSIIIPVYNVEKYIRPCMESIFKQGLDEDDYEVIIVNDGTPDKSMEVIEDIIAAHANITVINQKNLSLSVARNNGIAAAKGEYILMPDSDDLLIENSLKPLLDKALQTKADLVVADFLEMGDKEIDNLKEIPQKDFQVKEKTGYELFMEDLNPRQCYVWRTLYRRAFITENHLTFVPGIYLKAEKCLRVSWLLNIYRRGHDSATASFDKKKAYDLCIVIASTWKLRQIKELPHDVRQKLLDNIFTTFTLLIYFMLYGIKDIADRKDIFAFLHKQVPDLKFNNGMKQRLTSFLFRYSPHFYFYIRIVLKCYTRKPNFG